MARMPVTELNKKVASLEAQLNRKAEVKGAHVMCDADQAPNAYFLRRPCGIMQLDRHTGGGLPAGGLTYLSGPDGVGKTVLLYKYIAMNQRLYGERSCIALGVSESAPDHFFMRRCGIQLRVPEEAIEERVKERKIRGMAPFSKEELASFRERTVGQFKILRGANGEELLDAIIACFEASCFDIIGLDSVSALLPKVDSNKDMDDEVKRAGNALLLTKFFQHYLNGTTGYYGVNPTTVIFTSQVRANSKKSEVSAAIQKYILDYAPQGAWAAKHGKLIDILLKPGEKDKESDNTPAVATGFGPKPAAKARRIQVGKEIRYEVLKGKAGMHEGITGSYDFNYESLIDEQRTIVMEAIATGIAKEVDGKVTIFDPISRLPYKETEDMTIDEVTALLRSNFEMELVLRKAVLTANGIECAYR